MKDLQPHDLRGNEENEKSQEDRNVDFISTPYIVGIGL